MTTDLTTKDSAAIVERGAALPGLSGEFGQQDIVLPVCSLAQPMSQDKGEAGRYSFPDGSSLEQLDVVVLDIVATRALWAPIDDETVDGPLCRSADRVMGLTSHAKRVTGDKGAGDGEQYIVCKECPHFADATTFTKENTDPMCRFGYTLLMYERELDTPFLFFVKGSAVKPVKQRIVSPALQRYQRGEPPRPWLTPFLWSVTHKIDGKKNWYQPDITPQEPFTDKEALGWAEMSVSLSGRAAEQSVADPVAEEPVDPEQPSMIDAD